MNLDRTTCRRARLARDPRFDGRFFIGVKTTGVFCRPICPAVQPRERNVEYFPTAAAAAEAGFRACLRCRPECAPGTPAWAGVSATVARALRLIGDGALEADDVEQLASRLGIGARHLRRLFVEHLGATPIAVAQTRRLLSAKRLIDETDMPLTAVAMAAGYASIRRFNAAFLASYGRSPSDLRRTARNGRPAPNRRRSAFALRASADQSAARRGAADRSGVALRAPVDGNHSPTPPAAALTPYSFQLRYRPPLDWEALLVFLAPRAIPGVEVVDGRRYRRSIELTGRAGWLEVSPGDHDSLQLVIEFPDATAMLRIVSRVRRMFDLDADPMVIEAHLAQDPLLAPLVRRRPGLRVPGAWDGFELGVRAILGQQVSVAAATTLSGRLVARLGAGLAQPAGGVTHTFPLPPLVAAAEVAAIGIPAKRAHAIRCFAAAVANGSVTFDAAVDLDAFRQNVCRLPGVGAWTAEYMALRALGDPDAFPAGDLGLLRAAAIASADDLARRAEAWRPWRAYAALHLWTAHRSDGPKAREGRREPQKP